MNAPTTRTTSCTASVIILNWNGKHLLPDCLVSLAQQTFTDFETIIVDNGSTDGSVEWLRTIQSETIRLIENSRNLGFAEGNNQAIRAARGRYMILVNNDTVLDNRFLEELIKPAEKDREIGLCASKIVFHNDPSCIDAVGQLLYWDGLNRQKGHFETDRGQYDEDTEILFPPGCGSLYRKEMLDRIGLFDEDFFAYGEDTDLGLRGRLAGWKCICAPKAVIYHKRSGSTGEYSAFKAFHVERNRIWVAVKSFPLPLLLMTPFFTMYRYLFQVWAVFTKRGMAGKFASENSSLALVPILLKAYWSAFQFLPVMWRKRLAIRRLTVLSNREILDWFTYHGISARDIAFMN